MIRAAAAFARDQNCTMHVHVAEAAYEGERTLAEHGATPVRLLERLEALDERTIPIHAIYIDEEEKDLLAQRGARVVHNPMTNQYLGDGICDVVGLRSRGVPIALGTDADVKPSLIDEMRASSLLQKIRRTDGSALGAGAAFAMATREGARALGIATGDLVPGNFADYVVLDASRIDSWSPARQRARLSSRRPMGAGVVRRREARLHRRPVGTRSTSLATRTFDRSTFDHVVAALARHARQRVRVVFLPIQNVGFTRADGNSLTQLSS